MKKLLFTVIFIFQSLEIFAVPNLSPVAKDIFYKIKNMKSANYSTQAIATELQKNFLLKSLSNTTKENTSLQVSESAFFVSTIIRTNKSFNPEIIQKNGTKLVKISNTLFTAQVPLENYADFITAEGLEYVQADGFAEAFLDSALPAAKITPVKRGKNNLTQSYSGKGVIVGIVDWGFDYTHPAFYDSVNHRSRIVRVWDQTLAGTPPSLFSYGSELITPTDILNAKTDYTDASHGSHVAGIAAGEAWPSAGKYEGIATDAEIVFVALRHPRPDFTGYTNAFSDFVDAAKYIFDYAESVGKPVVINLSWGNVLGPKDGHSIISDALESMIGKGKIFVGSAGNSGKNNVHCLFKSNPSDTSISKTYFTYSSSISFTPKQIFVDAWGDYSRKFSINLSAIKSSSNTETVVQTGFFSTEKDTILTFKLPYSATDTVDITAFISPNEYNTRPRILLDIKSKNMIWFKIEGKTNESNIHLFSSLIKNGSGYISYFSKLNDTTALSGDAKYTICDWVSSDRTLCIGANVSKENYSNTLGQNFKMNQGYSGYRAAFSSIGPALDGRIKPDITAPGSIIASSVNAYDKNYGPISSSADMVLRITYHGKTYSYAAYQGTSMSSPVVTGSIALLLEANPNLTPEEVISLLKTTAKVDSCTSDTLPDIYSGYGKLNLLAAFGKMLGINSIENNTNLASSEFNIYPNPANNFIDISGNGISNEYYEYSLYNNLGEEIYTKKITPFENRIDLHQFPNGVYFVKLIGTDKTLTKKFLLQR